MKRLMLGLILSFTMSSPLHADNAASSPGQVMQEYFSNLQSGKFAELMALLDDNVVWHQPGNNKLSGTHVGKEAVGKLFANFMSISNGTFKIDEVKHIMVNGEFATATLSFSAHRCQYFDVSISKDGGSMDGVDLMKIVDGKIKEVYLFSADQDSEDNFWGKR